MTTPETRRATFHPTGVRPAQWEAEVDGRAWLVNGEGPDGPFTLAVDGTEVARLAAWPAPWGRSVVTRAWVRELFAQRRAESAASLARAEAEAAASGKEPFSLARLREYGCPLPTRNEADLRAHYYVLHPELRTLAQYAAYCASIEPWRDSS